MSDKLSFISRFWLAWICFFRILFDGVFAARIASAQNPKTLLPPEEPKPSIAVPFKEPKVSVERDLESAVQLLALLQRDGRLVDFLEQDVVGFSDAEVGAAARVVHEGCRKVLRTHVELLPIRTEEEGSKIHVEDGYKPNEIKLTGNVQGKAPYSGVLQHRGWKLSKITLPISLGEEDSKVIAPAEVEL